jgi:dipeptidyl aminopeptidase/acylaminoacyl peptidase
LLHTSDDGAVNILNNVYMQKALAEHNIPYEAHIYPHGPHGAALGNEITGSNPAIIIPAFAEWPRLAANWMKTETF